MIDDRDPDMGGDRRRRFLPHRTGRWVLGAAAAIFAVAVLLALAGCSPAPEPYASRHQPLRPAPAAEPLRAEPGDFWKTR